MSEENILYGDKGGGRQSAMRVNYPGNSQRAKPAVVPDPQPERPRIEPVVKGEVTTRKRGVAGRFIHGFVSEDAPTVVGWLALEVLMPAAKNLVSDLVSQGVDRVLYGESRGSRGSSAGRNAYTNYQQRFGTGATRTGTADPRPPLSHQARARHEFSEILIPTRGEAEEVLDGMRELIDLYSQCSVADMYDLCAISSDFTDNKWGWDDLRSAVIRQVRGGYVLGLPRTIPIS